MNVIDGTSGNPVAVAHGPRRGERFVLRVEELDGDGLGVARLHALLGPQQVPRTWRFELRATFPGDVVEVEAGGARRGDAWGRVVALHEASPWREPPRCPHAAASPADRRACGGCPLQAIPHARQLGAKHERVERLLVRALGPETVVRAPIAAPSPWNWRNKMELSFGRDADGAFALGQHPGGYRYEVFRLRECHLLPPDAAALAVQLGAELEGLGLEPHDERRAQGWLRTLTVRATTTGDRLLEVTTADVDAVATGTGELAQPDAAALLVPALARAEAVGGGRCTSFWWTRHRARAGERTRIESTLLRGAPTIDEELVIDGAGTLRFAIHPRAFFQPNTVQAGRLYAEVLRRVTEAVEPGDTVLDLYCGTGTIGVAVAAAGHRVIGIELEPSAVENGRANAARNDVALELHAGDVAAVLAETGLDRPGAAGVVIVDPPRSGLTPAALERIVSIGARRIVYVSCNPLSLARDAAMLIRSGYVAREVQPVDMFPHTAHIENVVALDRITHP